MEKAAHAMYALITSRISMKDQDRFSSWSVDQHIEMMHRKLLNAPEMTHGSVVAAALKHQKRAILHMKRAQSGVLVGGDPYHAENQVMQ
jgi:hypothetical protein